MRLASIPGSDPPSAAHEPREALDVQPVTLPGAGGILSAQIRLTDLPVVPALLRSAPDRSVGSGVNTLCKQSTLRPVCVDR